MNMQFTQFNIFAQINNKNFGVTFSLVFVTNILKRTRRDRRGYNL